MDLNIIAMDYVPYARYTIEYVVLLWLRRRRMATMSRLNIMGCNVHRTGCASVVTEAEDGYYGY